MQSNEKQRNAKIHHLKSTGHLQLGAVWPSQHHHCRHHRCPRDDADCGEAVTPCKEDK